MKFVFAVLLLAGLAFAEPESTPEAEADPAADAWYGYYGRGYGYGGYGYGHRYYGGYYGHPYGYGYYRGKRDAEADPAVLASSSALTAPQVVHPYAGVYGYGLPYAHHAIPVTHTVPAVTYAHPAAHVYHAGVYGYPYAGLYGYGLPVVAPAKEEAERKKREADPEADPEAEAAADAWYGYYGRPSYYGGWYGRGYGGYGGYYGGWGGYGLHGYRYGWGK